MQPRLLADVAAAVALLGPGRLMAPRFAGDAEPPGLVRRAASGGLATADDATRAVADGQPEHLRA